MLLYKLFRSKSQSREETEFVKVYRMTANGKEYKVILTKQKANRHTVIHCEHNCIKWEQVPLFPRFAGRNYGDKLPIHTAIPEKACITVFVVRGNPNGFVGLDDGHFRCADNFDEHCINVMSYQRFKQM